MFVFIMLRTGVTHIVNYRLGSGGFRTICSKTYHKVSQVNSITTLAADNTFPGMCMTCKKYYDEMYLSDLNEEPTMARNEVQLKHENIVDFQRYDIEGPKAKYEDVSGKKWWPKLIKYQRLVQKR